MRMRLVPLAVATLALALPAAAKGATICVPATGPGCNDSRTTITAALVPAQDDDTIRIAAGSYNESVDTSERLHFVGAGAGGLDSDAGATVIQASTLDALTMRAGGSVRGIKLRGGGSGRGLFLLPGNGSFSYSVTDVIGIGGNTTGDSSGGYGLDALSLDAMKAASLTVADSSFRGGNADSSPGRGASFAGPGLTASVVRSALLGGNPGDGFVYGDGATVRLTDSSVTGFRAIVGGDGTLEVLRGRIHSVTTPPFNAAEAITLQDVQVSYATNVSLTNSLIVARTGTPGFSVHALAALSSPGLGRVEVKARGSTFVSGGADPDGAIQLARATDPAAQPMTLVLENSIARLEGPAEADEADLIADRATITATNSSFNKRLELNGGTVTAPDTAGNVLGDPLLAADFSLQPGSPLVDRGNPFLVAAGEVDLAGATRSTDGNGDCVAVPDIGAFERAGLACPNVVPALTSVSATNKVFAPVKKGGKVSAAAKKKKKVKRGTRFRYRLSEAARVTVTIERKLSGRVKGKGKSKKCVKPTKKNRKAKRCARYKKVTTLRANKQAGKQSTAFTGRVKGKALKPGKYRARLVAVDAQGGRSKERRLALRIVRP